MYGRINNGDLILPTQVHRKLDGASVSGYALLVEQDAAFRAAEGWKEIEEIKPELGENQHYENRGFEEQADKIVITHIAVDNPPVPPTIEELQDQVEILTGIIADMLGV